MGPFQAELTVHRIGGPDVYETSPTGEGYYWERDYQETFALMSHTGWSLYGSHATNQMVRVQFEEVELVDADWLGGRVHLSDSNGRPISRTPAPFLVFGRPWDVPTWTHFVDEWLGHYSLGIRLTGTALDISKSRAEAAEARAREQLPAEAYAAGERAPAVEGEPA